LPEICRVSPIVEVGAWRCWPHEAVPKGGGIVRFLELTKDRLGNYDVGVGQSGRGPDTLINPAHITVARAKGWRSQRTSITVGSGFFYTLNMPVREFAQWLANWSP
jgi:hypothetical protein